MLGSDPTLLNMLDYHILSLGHRYRIVGCKLQDYRDLAFLQLNKGGEFVVLLTYSKFLLVLTSAEMRWKRIENVPDYALALVTFRGRFYAGFLSGEIVVIDPHSLEVTPLMPPSGPAPYLVPSGNDELFLVEVTLPTLGLEDINQLTCRVSRLEEEAGKWVEVSDLGNRVLFITVMGNVSCLAKELPHGCGLSGNSILFTHWHWPDSVTFAFKYGVHTGDAEDDLICWRPSRENRVMLLKNLFRPWLSGLSARL